MSEKKWKREKKLKEEPLKWKRIKGNKNWWNKYSALAERKKREKEEMVLTSPPSHTGRTPIKLKQSGYRIEESKVKRIKRKKMVRNER